jgi:multiple sugar transport system permease protein
MLRPLLHGLSQGVLSTPRSLWTALGLLVIAAALILMLWRLYTTIVMLSQREIGFLGGVLTLIGVAALALALAGIGQVCLHLPQWAAVPDGLQPPQWLTSPVWSKPALMLMGVFMAMGSNNMLMYLAALSNVPVELKEAASMDGASPWQSFRHVIWPQMAPTTFFIVIMSTIGGLQGGFDTAKVYLYQRGFTDFQLGFSSAIAWAMFLMIFVLTLVNWKFGNTMVND